MKKNKRKPESNFKVAAVGIFPGDITERVSKVHALALMKKVGDGDLADSLEENSRMGGKK